MLVPIGFCDRLRAGEVKNHSVNRATRMSGETLQRAARQLALRNERHEKVVVIQKMNGYVGSKMEACYR